MRRSRIGVFPETELSRRDRLWAMLGRIFPVCFETCSCLQEYQGDAIVAFQNAQRFVAEELRVKNILVFLDGTARLADNELGHIEFGYSASLPAYFRGEKVFDSNVKIAGELSLQDSDIVLASQRGRSLWTQRVMGRSTVEFVVARLPEMGEASFLCECFRSEQFFSLFPLVHFLRKVALYSRWTVPKPRACFMFDDPNLHARRYGFVDFAELARHAEKFNYHVSFATIPLDKWLLSRRACKIFTDSPERLSLLIHGNNHTYEELASTVDEPAQVALIAQALERISDLERRSGLHIARVMAAPHGACSESMLATMSRMGFEAACISYGSLRRYNHNSAWTREIGLAMAETINGLPVVPRFGLAGATRCQILLSAFLDQPIVLAGHHNDLAQGLDGLACCAEWINGLEDVSWMDMGSIARSNYCSIYDDQALHLVMHSNLIRLALPSCINTLFLHGGPAGGRNIEEPSWTVRHSNGSEEPVSAGQGLRVTPGCPVEVRRTFLRGSNSRPLSKGTMRMWPVLRRLLTECRDRFSPLKSRFTIRQKKLSD